MKSARSPVEHKEEKKKMTDEGIRESLEEEEQSDGKWPIKLKLRPDIILHPRLAYDCKETTIYLKKMRLLADRITSLFISTYTLNVDNIPENEKLFKKPSWINLSQYLLEVQELDDANMKILKNLSGYATNSAIVEEKVFEKTQAYEPIQNIYYMATEKRAECFDRNKMVTDWLKKCNVRRKMVEKAQILVDLKDKGEFYALALKRLNFECQELNVLNKNIDANAHHHFQHMKEIMVYFTKVTQFRSEALSGIPNSSNKFEGIKSLKKLKKSLDIPSIEQK